MENKTDDGGKLVLRIVLAVLILPRVAKRMSERKRRLEASA